MARRLPMGRPGVTLWVEVDARFRACWREGGGAGARRHPLFFACPPGRGLWVPRPAAAGEPADQLKAAVDQVIKILEDPSLKASGKGEARREAIRRVTDGLFDWEETARQSLGPHWRQRTDVERRQFVALFRELLERTYLSKIELYSGEKISYVGDSVDGDMATVRTVMLTKKQQEVPIDYPMIRRRHRRLVFDVAVA